MRKILVFIVLPILFAVLGGYFFEFTQRIPKDSWELIWGSQYELYKLDSRPIQILDAQSNDVYVKVESDKTYYCNHETSTCEQINILNTQGNYDTLEVSRDFSRWEAPSFRGSEIDIVRLTLGLHETLVYQYYLTASDGSIWFWARRDNLYDDFAGWGGFGFLGFLVGLTVAFKLNDRPK